MPHAAAGRGGHPGDERDHRLGVVARVVLREELGRPLLGLAADLADHDDALGGVVAQEEVQAVDEVGAVEGVAADADAEGLAQADLGGLVDGLVGQGAGAGHDADAALLVDVAGHDADLALQKSKDNH